MNDDYELLDLYEQCLEYFDQCKNAHIFETDQNERDFANDVHEAYAIGDKVELRVLLSWFKQSLRGSFYDTY